MRRALPIALACLSLLMLADCGRRHPQQQDQQAQPQSAPAGSAQPAATAPAAPSSGGGLFSSCPQAPLKSQVEATIGSAMKQIYGGDETGAKFTVTAMNPGADCKTFAVSYKAQGTSANAPLVYGDDGKWSVVLYKKSYPVQ
jgi:hypothetical protein